MFFITNVLLCCTNEKKIISNISAQKETHLLCDMSDNTKEKAKIKYYSTVCTTARENCVSDKSTKERHQVLVVVRSYLCKFT
jgi:hypothetical protein